MSIHEIELELEKLKQSNPSELRALANTLSDAFSVLELATYAHHVKALRLGIGCEAERKTLHYALKALEVAMGNMHSALNAYGKADQENRAMLVERQRELIAKELS